MVNLSKLKSEKVRIERECLKLTEDLAAKAEALRMIEMQIEGAERQEGKEADRRRIGGWLRDALSRRGVIMLPPGDEDEPGD